MAEGCPVCSGKGVLNFTNSIASIECPCVEAAHQKKRAEEYKNLAMQFLNTICQVAEAIYRVLPVDGKPVAAMSKEHFKRVSEIIDARKN